MSDLTYGGGDGRAAGLTDVMLAQLKRAAPWLQFVGIVGIVFAALSFSGGLFFLVGSALMGTFLAELGADLFGGVLPGVAGIGMGFSWALFYAGAGVVTLIPAIFTLRFGTKISGYLRGRSPADLERAFTANASLWKFNGILYIVTLALSGVAVVVAVVAVAAVLRGIPF